MTTRLRSAIDSATTLLADAGIDSARYDAEQLAAHLAGTDRGRLTLLEPPDDEFFARYRDLTVGGFYSTPAGHQDLGYIGNVALPRFDGPPPELLRKLGLGPGTS